MIELYRFHRNIQPTASSRNMAQEYHRTIRAAINSGDLPKALDIMRRWTQIDPECESLARERVRVSDVLRYLRNFDESIAEKNYHYALDNIDKVMKICLDSIIHKVKKGECLALLERKEDIEELVNTMRDHGTEVKYLSALCLYQSDINEARNKLEEIRHYEKALDLYEKATRFIAKKNEGNEYFKNKNYQRAHEIYSEAMEIDPDSRKMKSVLYNNMAVASYHMEQFKKSIEEATKALEINSNYVNALKRRGKCYMARKQYVLAIEDFSRALEPIDSRNENPNDLNEIIELWSEAIFGDLATSTDSLEMFDMECRKLLRRFHPDKHSTATPEMKNKYEERCKAISNLRRTRKNGSNADSPIFQLKNKSSKRPCVCKTGCLSSRCGCRKKGISCTGRCGCRDKCSSNGHLSRQYSRPSASYSQRILRSSNSQMNQSSHRLHISYETMSPRQLRSSAASSNKHICLCKNQCTGQCGCFKKKSPCDESCRCKGNCPKTELF